MTPNNWFQRTAQLTIILIYLVILAGGVVRASGSGMGCPDWPKCFGQWVPPTQKSELPANYKDAFAQKRLQKNQKIAKLAQKLGYTSLANQLLQDKSMYIEQDFNALKTWIEYVNRLLGVLVGIFIFLTTAIAFFQRKQRPKVFWYSAAATVLVGLQGFLGAFVVSTNLLPSLVTIHLLIALAILALLIVAKNTSNQGTNYPIPKKIQYLYAAFLAVILLQIVAGSQVRQNIDAISTQIPNRFFWVENLSAIYKVHRSTAWLVIVLITAIGYLTHKNKLPKKHLVYPIVLIFAQVFTGLALSYLGLPPTAQALHILFSSLLFGTSLKAALYPQTNTF